jgi:hypothetical protein
MAEYLGIDGGQPQKHAFSFIGLFDVLAVRMYGQVQCARAMRKANRCREQFTDIDRWSIRDSTMDSFLCVRTSVFASSCAEIDGDGPSVLDQLDLQATTMEACIEFCISFPFTVMKGNTYGSQQALQFRV